MCGTNLHDVSALLTGKLRLNEDVERSPVPDGEKRRRLLRQGLVLTFGGIIIALFFAIIGGSLSILDKQVGDFVENLGALGALVFVIGVATMVFSRVLPKAPAPHDKPGKTRARRCPIPSRRSINHQR
ncbi:MAG TPA: hypothetical protein VI756_23530 [Blastocatellia bacterium]